VKKVLSLFLVFLVSAILAAFSWPWEKEEGSFPTSQEAAPVKQEMREEPAAREEVEKAPTEAKLRPTTSRPVAMPIVAPHIRALIPDPSVVSSQIQQVIQLNKKRQMELVRQMKVLNETAKRAKLYNKILRNMYPVSATHNLAARAVTQEKVRLIHQEVKKLGAISVQTVPTVSSANQAKAIAERSSQAGLLPIGINQKQS